MHRRAFYADLLERTGWTFVQSFFAAWIVLDVEPFSGDALKVAAVAAVIAVGKSLIANQLPWTAHGSASTLPAEQDPPVRKRVPRKAAAKKQAGQAWVPGLVVVVLLILLILALTGRL